MFETTGVINEKLLKEIKMHILGRSRKLTFLAGIVIFTIAAVLNFMVDNTTLGKISLVCLAALVIEYFVLIQKNIKSSLKRMTEVGGKPETEYSSRLESDGLWLHNHVTGAEGVIKYSDFKKFIETESAYFLFTKAGQFAVMFKDGSFDRDELVAFLKRKPTQIKWKI